MNFRAIICTVAGLLAVIVLTAFVPHQLLTPKGIVLPAGKVLPAISPDKVMIYDQAPRGYFMPMGEVRTELEFRALDDQTKMALFEKVKSLAASIGANGVIVKFLMPNDGVRQMITFIGTAIYVPKQ